MKDELTFEEAWRVLDYDPKTGVFTRKVRLAQRHHAGDRADTIVTGGQLKGYRRVSLFNKRYLAHRLAVFMLTGAWPAAQVDHIDGEKARNAFSNLRVVEPRINAENRRRALASNTTGLLGVHIHQPGVYRARLQVRGKSIHVGLFSDPDEAHKAYLAAKRIHHEGCTL